MACKPAKIENVLLVDVRGDPGCRHDYTYLDSEMNHAGKKSNVWKSVNLTIRWECTKCKRIVSQVKLFTVPKSTEKLPLIETEDEQTK